MIGRSVALAVKEVVEQKARHGSQTGSRLRRYTHDEKLRAMKHWVIAPWRAANALHADDRVSCSGGSIYLSRLAQKH